MLEVLTVFGLYTHSEMHRVFWDKLGRQRGRQGIEYRKAWDLSLARSVHKMLT
jgi:hypothetical protein